MYLLLILLHIIADADMLMLVLVLILLVAGHAGNVWSQFDYAESKVYRSKLHLGLVYSIEYILYFFFIFAFALHNTRRRDLQFN